MPATARIVRPGVRTDRGRFRRVARRLPGVRRQPRQPQRRGACNRHPSGLRRGAGVRRCGRGHPALRREPGWRGGHSLATQVSAAGMVLRSPFVDLASVASDAYPFLPVRWLLQDKLPVLEPIRDVHIPVAVVYGTADSIVDPAQSRLVAEAAPNTVATPRGRRSRPQRCRPGVRTGGCCGRTDSRRRLTTRLRAA